MIVTTRLRLKKDKPFMGKGVRELLIAIDETASLRQASIKTGISYPKALRMVKDLNEEMGFEIVHSIKGGNDGGGSALSDQGRIFLNDFIEVEDKVQEYAEQLARDKWGEEEVK